VGERERHPPSPLPPVNFEKVKIKKKGMKYTEHEYQK
jgi:hypothetical protein